MEDRAEQALKLLKEIEWLGFQENQTCVYCGRNRANGHWQECRYAKALSLLETPSEPAKAEPKFYTDIHPDINLETTKAEPDESSMMWAEGSYGRIFDKAKAEPDHFAHARKTIAGWAKWKQGINCNPIPVPKAEPKPDDGFTENARRLLRGCGDGPMVVQKDWVLEACSRLDAQAKEISELTAENLSRERRIEFLTAENAALTASLNEKAERIEKLEDFLRLEIDHIEAFIEVADRPERDNMENTKLRLEQALKPGE